jgi:Flp pilus assembly secretin CpaC
MRRIVCLAALAAALVVPTGAAAAVPALSVEVEPTTVTTKPGQSFSLESTITNSGSSAAIGLVAHLNILSLRPGVYVDPEDWSEDRTRYLGPIPAGGSTTLTWTVKAVNSGSIGVYVAVFPSSGVGRPVTGPTLRASIAERKTLNAEGIVPLALGVPALLGALAVGVRLRRRR